MMIQRALLLGLLAILAVSLTGCAGVPALESSQFTPLQIRAIETRNFDSQDAKIILKAILNVLQDEGFLVDYGNSELGLLHASRTLAGMTTDQSYSAAIALFGLEGHRANGSVTVIEATVNVTDFGKQVRVRINFQRRETGPADYFILGRPPIFVTTAVPVTDPRVYQEFFAKLDRGLFIQKQGL